MLKLAWSCGHDPYHYGCFSPFLAGEKSKEHFLARQVVEKGRQIIKDRNLDVEVYTPIHPNPKELSAGGVLNWKIRMINEYKADFAIESHFNSAGSQTAKGIETIYFSVPFTNKFSSKGKKLAECIHFNTLNSCPYLADRGTKGMASILRNYGSGENPARFAFLTKTNMPAVILEPLFLSSPKDCENLIINYDQTIEQLAQGVVNGIQQFMEEVLK